MLECFLTVGGRVGWGLTVSSAPANWYPDPHDPSHLRYWDGSQWTEHRSPAVPAVQAEPAAPPASDRPWVDQPRPTGPQGRAERKVPLFGAWNVARQQAEELDQLRAEMNRLGVLDVAELAHERDRLSAEIAAQRVRLATERTQLEHRLAELRQRVAVTQEEEEILQEVGVYTYRHPLQDSVAYQTQLQVLQGQIKTLTQRDGGAIESSTTWQVNGSVAEGRKMVRDFSKLMLRAYNADDETNLEFPIRDRGRNGFNIGAESAAGFLPDVEILDFASSHHDGEHDLPGPADALVGNGEMELHGVVAVREFAGKFAHAETLRPVDRGRLGVSDLQVRPLHRVSIQEALGGKPRDPGLVGVWFLQAGHDANGPCGFRRFGRRCRGGRSVGRKRRTGDKEQNGENAGDDGRREECFSMIHERWFLLVADLSEPKFAKSA